MSLPVLAKTWQYNVNQAFAMQATITDTSRLIMYAIKTSLTGWASNPWAVAGSSNGSAAGMDAIDRWTSAGSLIWNTTVSGLGRSWIVLAQTGLGPGYQLCIDLASNGTGDGRAGVIVVSPSAGFTGGSTTARPTATDEMQINAGAWGTQANMNYKLHVWQSTDGQCTRLMIYGNNVCSGLAILDRVANPVSGWTLPTVSCWRGESANATPVNTYFLLTNPNSNSEIFYARGSATMRGTMTLEGHNSAQLASVLTFANELSGEWPMFPIGFYVPNTPSHRGRHGTFYDLWMGSTSVVTADTYPSDGSMQFVQAGPLVFPWNGAPTIQTI